jgi:hypothetical protein
MSLSGWHLSEVKPSIFSCKYSFTRGTPANYIYRLDYPGKIKDREDYLNAFRDAGWIHVDRLLNNWEFFRTEKEVHHNEMPVIYTDKSSKIEKYKRALWIHLIIAGLLSVNLFNTLFTDSLVGLEEMKTVYLFSLTISIVSIPLLLIITYAIFRTVIRIKSLGAPT